MLNIAKKEHADNFGKVWTHNGIAIFLDDVHKQFAVDFANMILTSYVAEQHRKLQEAAKPKIVLAE